MLFDDEDGRCNMRKTLEQVEAWKMVDFADNNLDSDLVCVCWIDFIQISP